MKPRPLEWLGFFAYSPRNAEKSRIDDKTLKIDDKLKKTDDKHQKTDDKPLNNSLNIAPVSASLR